MKVVTKWIKDKTLNVFSMVIKKSWSQSNSKFLKITEFVTQVTHFIIQGFSK